MKPRHAVALALGLVSDGAAVAFAAPHPPPGSFIWLDPWFPAHKFLPSQLARHYAIGLTG
jgi:hypothetical protein